MRCWIGPLLALCLVATGAVRPVAAERAPRHDRHMPKLEAANLALGAHFNARRSGQAPERRATSSPEVVAVLPARVTLLHAATATLAERLAEPCAAYPHLITPCSRGPP